MNGFASTSDANPFGALRAGSNGGVGNSSRPRITLRSMTYNEADFVLDGVDLR